MDKLDKVKDKYQLPDDFVLYVGSIEERKNLMLIAKAMNLVAKEEEANTKKGTKLENCIHVVAVGRRTPYVDEVQAYLQATGHRASLPLLSSSALRGLASLL